MLFFVAIGSLLDPGALGSGIGWLALLAVLLVTTKVGLAWLLSRLGGLTRPGQVAIGLGQMGEFSFVLVSLLAAAAPSRRAACCGTGRRGAEHRAVRGGRAVAGRRLGTMTNELLVTRLAGADWGHLIGDAVGVPYEFRSSDQIGEVRFGATGSYHQPPGTWSDAVGCLLRANGLGPEEAIHLTRASRPGTIETSEQADYVRRWRT